MYSIVYHTRTNDVLHTRHVYNLALVVYFQSQTLFTIDSYPLGLVILYFDNRHMSPCELINDGSVLFLPTLFVILTVCSTVLL